MEEPAKEPEKKEEVEETPRAKQTVWDKYKNKLFWILGGTFLAFQLNLVPSFNYVIFVAIIIAVVYLYSQAEARGWFGGAVPYKFADVLDEADKIANLLLERKGWRLIFERVEPQGKYGHKAHEPFIIYYLYRMYNKKTHAYDLWLLVAQSVLDKDRKNCGITELRVFPYNPVETAEKSWSGVPLGEKYMPTAPIVTRVIERPVARAPPSEEEEWEE